MRAALPLVVKVVIPVGSGQVGQLVARAFPAAGDEVVVLSRGAGVPAGRVVPSSRIGRRRRATS